MGLNQISSPNRKTLGEVAYKAIRDEIISLRFEPGQMIYENELAASLGVSRTPIREAFLMLLKDELIEILPQRGARVAYISSKKVEEARFVRESLEKSAFRAVARNWNENEERYKKLRIETMQLLEDQHKAAAKGESIEFLHLDEAFHHLILEQIENHTLLSVISQMRGHLNRMRYLELKEAHEMTKLIEQHTSIFHSITSNDEQKTEMLLSHHLQQLKDELPRIIQKYSHYFSAQ
ncbi:GntR family transcriptional regulator [Ammoniphilus sp. 3BR4]|uniref:GntR family transcriptional regulator n=1 Tax=Ammoniphilus sp. 3BR4 TaxID=3158265 RepID=UPI003466977E